MISFIESIARMEGWLADPPARNRRNRNPGNLEYGDFAKSQGAIDSDGRFAIFATDADGFNAMSVLLKRKYVGKTIAEAIAIYAPAVENDVKAYVKNVCSWTKLSADTVLTDELLSPPDPFPKDVT